MNFRAASPIFLVFTFFIVNLSAQTKITVIGKIESTKQTDLDQIQLLLLHYDPTKTQKVEELGKVKAEVDGSFRLNSIPLKIGKRYLMAIFYRGDHFPSKLITYNGENPFFFEINLDTLYTPLPNSLKVKGRITSKTKKIPPKTPVMLLKFDPKIKQGPPMSPVIRSETGEDGEFKFPPIKPENGVSYLVGALVGENRFSSEMTEYKRQESLTFLFEMPANKGSSKNPPQKIPEKVTVTGKLTSKGKISLSKIPLMILRFNPSQSEGPPISPVQRSETDKNGNFNIVFEKPDPGMSYMVGALINGERLSSKMQEYTDQKKLEFVLEIPFFNDDYSKLSFDESSLVFTPIEEGVRVTEIVRMTNEGDSVLYSKKNAPSKPLPEGAKNFHFFREQETDRKQIFADDRFNLSFQIKPGKNSAFIEYDLDRDLTGILIKQRFFPGTQSFQILVKKNSLKVIPKNLFMELKDRIIKDDKGIDDQYTVFNTELEPGTESVQIQLRNLPIPKYYFQILSGIFVGFFVLIFFGAFVVLRHRKNAGLSKKNFPVSV